MTSLFLVLVNTFPHPMFLTAMTTNIISTKVLANPQNCSKKKKHESESLIIMQKITFKFCLNNFPFGYRANFPYN